MVVAQWFWQWHRPAVTGFLVPQAVCASLRVMVMLVAVNIAVQPVSHSLPTEMREFDLSCGKMCTRLAVSGKLGILKRVV